MNPQLEITNFMLDIVLNHIRENNEHISKAAEKAGIEYYSLEFIQLMDHLCERGVVQKVGSSYLITLFGRQFKGFVFETEELVKEKELEKEKRTRDEERDKYDLLTKKFVYSWRWTPWIMSFAALTVSIFAYFKNSDKPQIKSEFSASTIKQDTISSKITPKTTIVGQPNVNKEK